MGDSVMVCADIWGKLIIGVRKTGTPLQTDLSSTPAVVSRYFRPLLFSLKTLRSIGHYKSEHSE